MPQPVTYSPISEPRPSGSGRFILKVLALFWLALAIALAQGGRSAAPVKGGKGGPPPVPRKHILVVGFTHGWHHGSTSNAMATFWKLGNESGVWDTEIKTDAGWITKTPPGPGDSHNLDFFDAIVLVNTTGDWGLNDEQKKALLSFVHDDGKGLVAAHAALDANYEWPEYAEMLGGWFEAHPWLTFDAPVIIEDPTFPATRHFSATHLRIHDEMYSPKNWSRDKVNVLMRLDATQLDYSKVTNARADKDQAIAWSKMYGKGRVFWSSLGHTKEAWDDPDVQKMYVEAVKWVLGRTEGSTASHPKRN